MPDAITSQTISYPKITLLFEDKTINSLTVTNKTLNQKINNTITLKGYKNQNGMFVYNLPLVQGENEIEINASNDIGSKSKTVTIDANITSPVPIGLKPTKYSGVGSLDTQVAVLTSLKAKKYFLDLSLIHI